MQLGSVVYNNPNASGFIPGSSAAVNGLSINSSGQIVLGQDIGQAGNPAKLLNSREIPLNAFTLDFNQIGLGGISLVRFRKDPTSTAPFPFLQWYNPAGTLVAEWRSPGVNALHVGNNCGAASTGGGQTTAFGTNAFSSSANGSNNLVAIGYNAMANTTTGAGQAVAIGFQALMNNGGANNTGVGSSALTALTTGVANTAYGLNSGLGLLTGNSNTFIGDTAGGVCTADSFNVLVGTTVMVSTGVGHNNNGASGGSNSMLGYGAGSFLVSFAGTTTTYNNCICIGNFNGVFTEGTALSNTTIIGNQIATNVSNIVMLGKTTQNVQIGAANNTADNGNRLQVAGKFNTGGAAPLTLGAGNMDFGKIVTAASVLNATKYWEVVVDGVLVKVCIN